MSGCCHGDDETPAPQSPDHCHTDGASSRRDPLLYGTAIIVAAAIALHLSPVTIPYISPFADAASMMMGTVWWGILAGMLAVGLMNKVPREYFSALLGRGDTAGGIFRAALAGLLLDLCSHGILMVGAKLYERGASLAQVVTFLIASPWNSFSLTLILIALIGWKLTLLFIAGSALIAVISGFIFMKLTARGVLPGNPHTATEPPAAGFSVMTDAKNRLKTFRPTPAFFAEIVSGGWQDSRMVLRWLLLGVVIAALIRAFVPADALGAWFGPNLTGLLLTLAATTVIEVCSEGATPIAAELVNRAGAVGNGFAFLMAGVATDYTEIMVIRQFTGSWKAAFFLPLVTVPQVILLGWLMNAAG